MVLVELDLLLPLRQQVMRTVDKAACLLDGRSNLTIVGNGGASTAVKLKKGLPEMTCSVLKLCLDRTSQALRDEGVCLSGHFERTVRGAHTGLAWS